MTMVNWKLNRYRSGRPEVLAIIPARGGSKGIPGKNIVDLGGKPLLAWSIASALESGRVTRVLVSTDDEKIADVARAFGADVPFLRSVDTSGDYCSTEAASDEVLSRLAEQGYRPDVTVQLYPTSPFREPGLVDHLIGKLLEGVQQVKTVRGVSRSVQQDRSTGALRPVRETFENPVRAYGLFYGTNHASHSPYTYYLHKITDPLGCIDIDTPGDLELARQAVDKGWVSWLAN